MADKLFSKISSWLVKYQESLLRTELLFLKLKGGIDASSSFLAYKLTFKVATLPVLAGKSGCSGLRATSFWL